MLLAAQDGRIGKRLVKALLATATLALAGCATCREHPAMCATAGAVIVGGAVLAAQGGGSSATANNVRGWHTNQPH